MTFLMNFAFNHFLFDFSLVLRVKIFISIFIFFIVLLLLDQNPLMNAGLSNRAVFLFLRIIFLALRRRIPMKDFIHTRLPASHI